MAQLPAMLLPHQPQIGGADGDREPEHQRALPAQARSAMRCEWRSDDRRGSGLAGKGILDTAHFHQVMDVSTRADVLSGVGRRLH